MWPPHPAIAFYRQPGAIRREFLIEYVHIHLIVWIIYRRWRRRARRGRTGTAEHDDHEQYKNHISAPHTVLLTAEVGSTNLVWYVYHCR
jgi:hypothetical protein